MLPDLRNKKIAIYGGSFNPIHIGHLLGAVSVKENFDFDYIIFIPANKPAHKELDSLTPSPTQRLRMTEMAVKGIDYFCASDVELKRGGVSYTIDTVDYFLNEHKVLPKPGVIIGTDLIPGLDSWKEIGRLSEISRLICITRDNQKTVNKYGIEFLNTPIIEMSSSFIRNRLNKGLNIDFMVTNNVKNYINKHKLYRI